MPKKVTNKTRHPNKTRGKKKDNFFLWMLMLIASGILMSVLIGVLILSTLPVPVPVMEVALIQPSPTPSPTPVPTPSPTPDPMEGLVFSPFNGLPVPEETLFHRPFAVVINNHSRALPQSGIADAEIIYEVLAEGNITRLVGIFHQLNSERIGPVRSTREYFADIALENDAIIAHHGGSPSGYARLRNHGIDRLDGMALEGTTFWRDQERWRVPAMREHSSYTGRDALLAAIERHNIRRYRQMELGLRFNTSAFMADTIFQKRPGFVPASEVVVPFSDQYFRTFIFDPYTKTYTVHNRNGPHIDENTGEPVSVTNILVQYVSMRLVAGDEEGRREVITTGSGAGHLISLGGLVEVTWRRENLSSPTRWYFGDGTPMLLNPGNTWICLLQNNVGIEVGV